MNATANTDRKLILVTNDDGFLAPGVQLLSEWLLPFGDVVCVSPEYPQSGQSMAITVNGAMRVTPVEGLVHPDVKLYKVNGTPVDCVKLSMHHILSRRPDLVVSGINHGSNASVNVLYSGTMGAAFEGAALGIPSVGFSLTSHALDADMSRCRPFVERIAADVLRYGLPDGVALNVNIPYKCPAPTEMRLVRSCRGNWNDEYREYTDPAGHPFYLLSGEFRNDEPEADDTDEYCLTHGIVSVVPCSIDRTAAVAPSLAARLTARL